MPLHAVTSVPDTPEQLARWATAHAVHHRDIVRLIFQNYGQQLSEFPLDPVPTGNMDTWLRQHQQMHTEMDMVLGIQGANLNKVDWEDEKSRAGWVELNAQEHYQAGQILGLG